MKLILKLWKLRPDAVQVFLQHGVDVPVECDESIQDWIPELCDSMCHIDNVDALIRELQKFFDATGTAEAVGASRNFSQER